MQIEGAVAIVTGANRGLGRAIAQKLIARGARHVYGTARTPDLSREGSSWDDRRFTSLKMDLCDEESLATVALLCNDVTLLVNNAGVLSHGDILEADLSVVRNEFETNTLGMINAVRQFAPVLARNGGGVVLNILSVSALATSPSLGIYAASKAASWAATQSFRTTLAEKNIRVLAAFPGPIDTGMAAGLTIPKAAPDDVAAVIVAAIEAEDAEIFPDAMARQVEAVWRSDPRLLMRQFTAL